MMNEDLCFRCGRCCYNKKKVGRFFVVTHQPCTHLNTKNNLCKIYYERIDTKTGDDVSKCGSIEKSIKNRQLPNDCPYIKIYEKETGKKYKSLVLNYNKIGGMK